MMCSCASGSLLALAESHILTLSSLLLSVMTTGAGAADSRTTLVLHFIQKLTPSSNGFPQFLQKAFILNSFKSFPQIYEMSGQITKYL
jgi:hypothetical protein